MRLIGRRLRPTPNERIILLTRYPQPGQTKTRLIPRLGAEGAAQLHRELTEHSLRQARRCAAAEIEVHWTGGDARSMRAWLPGTQRLRRQSDGDLGARMAAALQTAFEEGAARVLVAGCDSPDLGPETYEAAFAALQRHDVVIGPATDGGYYLIGARAAAAHAIGPLFSGIDWGTDRVLEQTLQRLERAGLSCARTAMLTDVDSPQDLKAWERHSDAKTPAPWLSIILPTLNEAGRIDATLRSINASPAAEVIVADGGSTDATCAIAAERGALVFHGARGRANQMNLGAAMASGDLLLFLHADTRLPPGYADAIRECLARPRAVAGAFRFATDFDSPAMRIVSAFTALRASAFQWPYGDQGLFLGKEVFRRTGGFPDLPIMEDFELVRRLRRLGRVEIANASVVTSGDRWRDLGAWRNTARNARIVALYFLGAEPSRLLQIYRRGRASRPVG